MKKFLSILLTASTLTSVLCTSSYAAEFNEPLDSIVSPASTEQVLIDYLYEFDLDLGDSNVLYYTFTPEHSRANCPVTIQFVWCTPRYEGARVNIEWESKAFNEGSNQYKSMGVSEVISYGDSGDTVEFQVPLYMMRDYRLKFTNLDYANKKFIAEFALSFSM